jgi:predicted outer membrane repeat protein
MFFSKRIVFLFGLLLSIYFVLSAQTTSRSYFVKADGDDTNNGRSEETAFKTISKAIQMAKAGAVRTITLLGKFGDIDFENTGSNEIIITGKPDANETEKAFIGCTVISGVSNIKFCYIDISDRDSQYGGGLVITGKGAIGTLGVGSIVQDCSNHGVTVKEGAILNMIENSIVTNNWDYEGGGIYLEGGTLNMKDNAVVKGNQALQRRTVAGLSGGTGGGIAGRSSRYGERCSISISDNAQIIDNTAVANGGGILLSGGTLNISGKVVVSNNTATDNGGGIYAYGNMQIDGSVTISSNTAKKGGGIFIYDGKSIYNGINITENKAEYGAGIYLDGNGVELLMNSGNFSKNIAEYVGGAIYIATGATYTQGKITTTGNSAGDGEGHDVFKQ